MVLLAQALLAAAQYGLIPHTFDTPAHRDAQGNLNVSGAAGTRSRPAPAVPRGAPLAGPD